MQSNTATGSAGKADSSKDQQAVTPAETDQEQDDQKNASREGTGGAASLADRRDTDQVPDPETRSQDDSGSRFPFLEKLFR